MSGISRNYSYFPIFIDLKEYGLTRNELYFKMKENNKLGRMYFYPLISTYLTYISIPSSVPENLPVATKMSNEVICLTMHHWLSDKDVQKVIDLINKK
ncbi:MAG: DegT/DnrJ/EryC1/StrS family aminotransferase [Bacteroidales bacterium]|nr:DegT/DnrJ/EryC1/StrS family aminotransferase [Bacteroidales bacterium]